MKTIDVKFINFWPEFDELAWFNDWKNTYHHPNIIWKLNRNHNPDVLVSSVFGSINIIKKYKCKKILYTRENLNHNHYRQYKYNLNLFDTVIGFEDKNNIINVPWYYDLIYQLNLNPNNIVVNKSKNRKNLCLVNNNFTFLRTKLLSSFEDKNYTVDCPGLVGKNIDAKTAIGWSKINFIKNYYFYICPENSYSDGYVTERVFESCVAGCVPIYYGCERLNDGFFNKNRVFHINRDLSNYDEIIDKTIHLLTNKDELLNFIDQNPFDTNYIQHINIIKQKIHNSLEKLLLN